MNLIDPKKSLDEKEGVVEIKNYLNKIKIIKNLYMNGSNTASEICNEVGISLPTVNSLLTDLIKAGKLVKQGRAESQGGRKPDLYRLAQDSFYVLALDISKFVVRAAIYDSSNQAVTETGTFKITLNNEKSTFDKIGDFMETYMQESGIPNEKIIAIGMSMPGLVDSVNGVNHTYLKFGKKSLVENFEARFDRKVFIENDADRKSVV